MSREVFVTGLGMISPAGVGVEPAWRALLSGRRAVGPLAGIDVTGCRTTFAGQTPDFTPPAGIEGRACQLAVAAASEALVHSGFSRAQQLPLGGGRARVVIGASKLLPDPLDSLGNSLDLPVQHSLYLRQAVFSSLSDAPARWVAFDAGITGGTYACVTACATGTHAVIRGTQMIER